MCTINPGLPPEEFDAFDSDEECSDPIEDEHHAILIAQLMQMPDSNIVIFSRFILPLLETF